MIKINWKIVTGTVVCLMMLIIAAMTYDTNDAGYRTVVQYPWGTMKVQFDPGWYLKLGGGTTVYPDALTMDFDEDKAASGAIIDQPGIPVQYGDGGMGTVFGKARFNLPNDKEAMLLLHREARGAKGVAYKVIQPVVKEAANQTAGLMNSADAYQSKRGIFTQWTKSQITEGLFQTESETKWVKDEVTGKSTSKQVAVIKTKDNKALHYTPDLQRYRITLATFQMNKPHFEPKTMEQIAKKRDAENAIITAKANAEKAKQDALTIEEQGKADLMKVRYAKLKEKEAAIVDAERKKETAVINAAQKVEVAQQYRDEMEQRKLAAEEIKQEQILLGEGEAARKKLVMEADGALAQKLQTYENVNRIWAEMAGKQKWVPEIQYGVTGDSSNGATTMMDLLATKAARDLALDMKVTKEVTE